MKIKDLLQQIKGNRVVQIVEINSLNKLRTVFKGFPYAISNELMLKDVYYKMMFSEDCICIYYKRLKENNYEIK